MASFLLEGLGLRILVVRFEWRTLVKASSIYRLPIAKFEREPLSPPLRTFLSGSL